MSLDHHFASVRTFSEISKMANPNQYPEFEKVKNLVKEKKDIEILFKDYTKSLNYIVQLGECRKNYDWDAITSKLDNYIDNMNKSQGVQKNKLLINLEFPIDRLIQFITQYNNFINEGEQFYQKFETI